MIVQELKRLAEREQLLADEGYGPQKIHYLISIDRDGRFLGMTSTLEPSPGGKGKPRPKLFSVPSPLGRRTSGAMANFLYDKADYVFGIGGNDPQKNAARKQLFREAIVEARAATGDEGLRAVEHFLARVDAGEVVPDVGDAPEGSVFSFLDFDDPASLISSRPAIRGYWRAKRSAQPGEEEDECIVCGSRSTIVRNHPEIKNVPGGNPAGVALVSFNNPAGWSFGFSDAERHRNAPVCRACADAYTRALNRLLAPEPGFPSPRDPTTTLPVQNYRLSSDTVAVYWSTGSDFASRFTKALHGDPAAVRALFDSPFVGREAPVDADRFFAIILSGAQGRAILRSALQSTVAETKAHLRRHFDDLALISQYPKEPEVYGLRDLAAALKPPGRTSATAPALIQQLFEAAILGRPYPHALLDAALRRLRSGDAFTRPRLSIIKAVLNRKKRAFNTQYKELTMALDTENTDPGYRLGRLFAVLERLQGDAINSPNATIVDRYYGSASATPAVVFPRLLGLAQHHASKSARGGFFQKLIEEISWGLDPANAFPSILSLDQQGLFALGYYHQRADLWRKKESPAPETKVEP
jgi:CRISPR-associated protein Csd1